MTEILEEEDIYQSDVFSEIEDDEPVVKRKLSKSKQSFRKSKHKKSTKLTKSVIDLQNRYTTIASNENATSEDWQKFYLSIEKMIMKQAYFNNFKHFIPKDSDLWGHLVTTLMDQIIPKKNIDGTRSCWYIDKSTNKIRTGYNSEKSNIGNFILNRTKYIIMEYNMHENEFTKKLVDTNIEPIPDSFDFPEIQKSINPEDQITVTGNQLNFVKELSSIIKLHTLANLN